MEKLGENAQADQTFCKVEYGRHKMFLMKKKRVMKPKSIRNFN